MKVYVATKNFGKLREMETLFDVASLELATFAEYEDPIEGDTSYADNAALKARALHAQLQRLGRKANVLADDSGLEVYALDRRPGVLTAYYGGAEMSWPQRRRRLIEELAETGSDDRRARFVCAMHFIDIEGREFAAMGTVDGEITTAERGDGGFSFDPVFQYGKNGLTFAEMNGEEEPRQSSRHCGARAGGCGDACRCRARLSAQRTR